MDLQNNPGLFEFIFQWGNLPKECYLQKKD